MLGYFVSALGRLCTRQSSSDRACIPKSLRAGGEGGLTQGRMDWSLRGAGTQSATSARTLWARSLDSDTTVSTSVLNTTQRKERCNRWRMERNVNRGRTRWPNGTAHKAELSTTHCPTIPLPYHTTAIPYRHKTNALGSGLPCSSHNGIVRSPLCTHEIGATNCLQIQSWQTNVRTTGTEDESARLPQSRSSKLLRVTDCITLGAKQQVPRGS